MKGSSEEILEANITLNMSYVSKNASVKFRDCDLLFRRMFQTDSQSILCVLSYLNSVYLLWNTPLLSADLPLHLRLLPSTDSWAEGIFDDICRLESCWDCRPATAAMLLAGFPSLLPLQSLCIALSLLSPCPRRWIWEVLRRTRRLACSLQPHGRNSCLLYW